MNWASFFLFATQSIPLTSFCCLLAKVFHTKMNFFDSWKFLTRKLFQNSPNAKVFVKNFAIFWARESFCPQKFLPLKYPTFVIPITDTRDLFGVGEVHVLRSKSIRGLLSKGDFCKYWSLCVEILGVYLFIWREILETHVLRNRCIF